MSEPFVGEIRMFAGTFAPRGWAFCDGRLLAVSQNDALFSLLGTEYGGDGRTTFALPDLRGRLPVHAGTGPGLSERRLGAKGGAENVTLATPQLPSHGHALLGTSSAAVSANPVGRVPARAEEDLYTSSASGAAGSLGVGLAASGGGQPHTNVMPFQCVNFIIALIGIYPSRQ